MSQPVWILRSALTAAVIVGAGAVATPAQATATGIAKVITNNKIEFRAATGKVNKVTVSGSGRVITIDDVVAIKAGTGCRAVRGDRTKVRCTTVDPANTVRIYTGNRNDTITSVAAVPVSGFGGSGNDVIRGGPAYDGLHGDAGNDKLYAGGGNDEWGNSDYLSGGDGNDILIGNAGHNSLSGDAGNDRLTGSGDKDELSGGPGNDVIGAGGGDDFIAESPARYAADRDVIAGGSGRDRLSYAGRRVGVKVDSDGVRGDDGSKGEGDTVSGIEEIFGGNGADTLYGTAGNDLLYGFEGNDVLHGMGGDDNLDGAAGKDRLYGEAGDDTLSGEDKPYIHEPDIEPEPVMAPDLLDGGPNGTALGDYCKLLEFDTAVACERS